MILLGQQQSATLQDKIRVLRSAGLGNAEIGELLGMTGPAVGKAFYDATKRGASKTRRKVRN
jgi:predicted transcriptional regulator